jgi:tetrahydromethanopterin S-methyltransferase subunit G
MSAGEKAVLEAAEKSLDAIEDRLDVIEQTAEHVRPGRLNLNGTTKGQQVAILAGTAVVGALAGGGLTYILLKKRLEMKYERIVKQEIQDAKEFYRRLNKTDENGENLSPEEVLEDLHGKEATEALRSYQGVTPEENQEDPEAEIETVAPSADAAQTAVQNIFVNSAPIDDSGWNYDVENAIRAEHPDQPYIIHHDEFFENEKEYEQTTLTFYEGDDTLADDKEAVVPDSDSTVGDDNLMRFGHGSKDENVVYVRNDRLELDFEIIRSDGKYSVEVLGLDDEDSLKHSYNRPGIRKFRHDD